MALVTVAKLKSHLRIETSAQDSVITDLLAEAKSWAESLTGRTITATSETMSSLWGSRDELLRSVIRLPVYPVDAVGLVLTDGDGDVVDPSEYTVDEDAGKIISVDDSWFSNPFYEVTATVGLSAGSQYAGKEPELNTLIKGLASILYFQRNPNAVSDSGGAGVSVSYQSSGALPMHLNSIVESFRGRRIA